jgi:hypothetical protein
MKAPHGAVLTFNTCSAPHLAARLHAPDCPMVNMAKNSRGRVTMIPSVDEEEIADLNERGFPVKACKCLKK